METKSRHGDRHWAKAAHQRELELRRAHMRREVKDIQAMKRVYEERPDLLAAPANAARYASLRQMEINLQLRRCTEVRDEQQT